MRSRDFSPQAAEGETFVSQTVLGSVAKGTSKVATFFEDKEKARKFWDDQVRAEGGEEEQMNPPGLCAVYSVTMPKTADAAAISAVTEKLESETIMGNTLQQTVG